MMIIIFLIVLAIQTTASHGFTMLPSANNQRAPSFLKAPKQFVRGDVSPPNLHSSFFSDMEASTIDALVDASSELVSDEAMYKTKNEWQIFPSRLERHVESKNLVKLVWYNDVEIYILGTCHVSKESVNDVQALLNHVRPEAIMVELCFPRMLRIATSMESKKKDKDDDTSKETRNRPSVLETIRQSRNSSIPFPLALVVNHMAADVEELAEAMGVEVGGEARMAYKYWKDAILRQKERTSQIQYPNLILGDRPFQITALRAWKSIKSMTRRTKGKLLLKFLGVSKTRLYGIVAGLVFGFVAGLAEGVLAFLVVWIFDIDFSTTTDVDDDDPLSRDAIANIMQSFRQECPQLYEIIIDERDKWMATKALQVCHDLAEGDDDNIRQERPLRLVTIVGAAHVSGIKKRLMQYFSEPDFSPAAGLAPLMSCGGSFAEDDLLAVPYVGLNPNATRS